MEVERKEKTAKEKVNNSWKERGRGASSKGTRQIQTCKQQDPTHPCHPRRRIRGRGKGKKESKEKEEEGRIVACDRHNTQHCAPFRRNLIGLLARRVYYSPEKRLVDYSRRYSKARDKGWNKRQ